MSDTRADEKPTDDKLSLKSRLLRQLRNLVIGYLMVVVMLAFLQRKLIYVPSREPDLSANRVVRSGDLNQVADVATTTGDGITLNGWHWKSGAVNGHDVADGRLVVLFFHGNGGHRLHRTDECEMFADLGADTVIFDYRGYGDNAGKPTEEGLALDAQAYWKFVTSELGVAPSRVVLLGGSLGGGVAVRLASELCEQGTRPAGIILRSTFSSLADAASYHYPWLPVRTVLVDRYPSTDRIGKVSCPVIAFHGTEDSVVPLKMGQTLFAATPENSANGIQKRFVEIANAGHNNVLQVGGHQVHKAIGEFFDTIRRYDPQ